MTTAERGAAEPARDLETVHLQLRREFAMVAGIAAALPASVAAQAPSLDDRIGIAAHSADRLLQTVRRTLIDAPVVDACVRQAQRVGSAVVGLHRVLAAAKLEPVSNAAADAVMYAVATMDQAVDDLYAEVAAAVPPESAED